MKVNNLPQESHRSHDDHDLSIQQGTRKWQQRQNQSYFSLWEAVKQSSLILDGAIVPSHTVHSRDIYYSLRWERLTSSERGSVSEWVSQSVSHCLEFGHVTLKAGLHYQDPSHRYRQYLQSYGPYGTIPWLYSTTGAVLRALGSRVSSIKTSLLASILIHRLRKNDGQEGRTDWLTHSSFHTHIKRKDAHLSFLHPYTVEQLLVN
jgi:hypothetical protein